MTTPSLSSLKRAVADLARPFTIYAGGVATFIGLFVPSVSADKLLVTASMAGALGIARAIENRTVAHANASVEIAKAQAGATS